LKYLTVAVKRPLGSRTDGAIACYTKCTCATQC